MDVVRCDTICKAFGGVRVLTDVSLKIQSEGPVAIVGPNGAGKTTFLNILTGFARPDSGRCFFGNRETTGLSPFRIARFGIARTFQDLRLIRHLSVLDNVLLACPHQRGERPLAAILHWGTAQEESANCLTAENLLQFVGLRDKKDVLANELSWGQQKLLTLACCLATGASTLFLDEPIAGVHPETASRIWDLVIQLQEQGKLVVFIEHDLAAVRRVAARVVVMDEGRIIADGQPADVLDRPDIMEAYIA